MRISLFQFALLFLFFGCAKTRKLEEYKPYTGPLMEVDNVYTLYTDSSVTRLKLKASKQLEMQNGDRFFPKGVYIEFFDEKGVRSSTITGNKGKYEKSTGLYIITGNVEVKSINESKKLNTEELYWDPNKKQVFSKKFVRIETPEEILTGEGLTANQDFSSYKIHKPSGIFSVDQ